MPSAPAFTLLLTRSWGLQTCFSGVAVSQSTSVSEPMFNATYWLTDSHIGRVETGKIVRPVPELCIWWAISQPCLRLLRSLDPFRGVEACRRVSQVSRFHNLLVCPSRCLMQPTDWLIHISDELRLGKVVRPIPELLYLGFWFNTISMSRVGYIRDL